MLSIGWSLGYRRDLSSLAFHWIPHVCFFFRSFCCAAVKLWVCVVFFKGFLFLSGCLLCVGVVCVVALLL